MVSNSRERRRVGLLVPSSNTVMEVDFHRNLPPEVTVHTARMYMEETTLEGEGRMLDEFVPQATRDLVTARPHIVVFGCTSAGALRGSAYDRKLCEGIARISGVPTISVVASVREAIAATKAKRIAIVTPYIPELNERIKRSVEEEGVEVASIHGMGISENFAIALVSPDEIVSFAVEKSKDVKADCLFVSCTNLRAVEALPRLREVFGIPVVTSNQAALEAVRRFLDGWL